MPICDGFFYYPNRHVYGKPEQMGLAYERVTFAAKDGPRLDGWFFPAAANADESPPGPAKGTVLHLHGNAGNMSGHFQHVAWLPAAGWNVLCFDYRGYGRSEGTVTREGTLRDAHAALDYLLARPDVDDHSIVAFGQSLGGAIGIVLAAERQEIRALATDGAFDSYRRIASCHIHRNPLLLCIAWWVPSVLMSNGHDPINAIGRIAPRPVLIIHGTADNIVPVEMAERLFHAAGEPRDLWLVDGADHYAPLREHGDEGRARLLAFFEKAVQGERLET
ncbi:MAG TPA: alpha/beta hydrolase [Phycisphaerae bacterium]|nr:alpha/beta hydrolase [Phycisphaerae bacterium]HOJ73473.1 alpha/beta hydrolase [Phycisphaerae bacterium]HOM51082.1 alpha/beta hydrolase [Phycisphaerae bacterium]HON68149.1 alpha/beta hydrolase [Phycisphaerae bacterium]HOQ85267.1 alpha/beta hydrolase [Phycisphaerae bacterium]